MRTLFLSVGHNFTPDEGASSQGTTEAKEVKKIVNTIATNGIPGVKVIKVPEKLNLNQRIAWINKELVKYPEPFAIELHLDSASPTARGASVWYRDGNEFTKKEGGQFLMKYTEITGLPSRHVNSDATNRHGRLGFVREVKCASLLIELGFISNVEDLKIIRNKGALGVIEGIKNTNIIN